MDYNIPQLLKFDNSLNSDKILFASSDRNCLVIVIENTSLIPLLITFSETSLRLLR